MVPLPLEAGDGRVPCRGRAAGRRQVARGPTASSPRPRPPRTQLTHPKVLMKPLTEPSAYRDTMSPMCRKLDISLMAAALRGAGVVGGAQGRAAGLGAEDGDDRETGRGASSPRSRALGAAGTGQRPPERKAARRGQEPAVRRWPRLGATAARRPAAPARAYLQRRRSRKSGAVTLTCKSRPGGGEATPQPPRTLRGPPPAPTCAGPPPAARAPRAARPSLPDARRAARPAELRGVLGSSRLPWTQFPLPGATTPGGPRRGGCPPSGFPGPSARFAGSWRAPRAEDPVAPWPRPPCGHRADSAPRGALIPFAAQIEIHLSPREKAFHCTIERARASRGNEAMGWVLFFSLRIPVHKEIQLPNLFSRSLSRSWLQNSWLFPSFFLKKEEGSGGERYLR